MASRKAQTSSNAARPRSIRDGDAAPRVGWIAAGSVPARLLVDWPGSPHGPVAARSVVPLDDVALAQAARERRPVVLLFEKGDARLPLLVGLVQSSSPLLDAVLGSTSPSRTVEAAERPDGRRRLIEAADELVLECGKASITMRRDGKIVIRGAYVETHAAGTNRIKGGAVKIN
jgi:hypothetical protein